MPQLTHSVELVVGTEKGELRYRAPGPNERYEFWTKMELLLKPTEPKRTELDIQREAGAAYRLLAASCVHMLEGEWEEHKSGVRLSPVQARAWAEDYPDYALALGQQIQNQFWPVKDEPKDDGGDVTEPDPTRSSE